MNEFLLSRGLCNDGLKLSILDIQITWFNNSLQNSVQYENLQLRYLLFHPLCKICKMGDGRRLAAHWWWNSIRVFHPGHPQNPGPGHPSPSLYTCTAQYSPQYSTRPQNFQSSSLQNAFIKLFPEYPTAVNIYRGQTLVQLDLFLLVAAKRNNKSPICGGDIIFQ